MTQQRTVLHIGAGKATIAKMPIGFRDGSWREIRYDISPEVKPDIIGSVTDMSAVDTASVDAVYSSHNIEHVFEHEVDTVFRECLRVLRPDGFLVVTCPDIETVAHHIVRNGLDTPVYESAMGPIRPIDILYGHSGAIANGAVYMAHRTGFSMQTLQNAASKAGFQAVLGRRRAEFVDLWLVGTPGEVSREVITDLMDNFGGPRSKFTASPSSNANVVFAAS